MNDKGWPEVEVYLNHVSKKLMLKNISNTDKPIIPIYFNFNEKKYLLYSGDTLSLNLKTEFVQ